MADMRAKMSELYSLEQLSSQKSSIHALHPLSKIIATLTYIICVVSLDGYSFSQLAPFVFYPVIVIALADIPYSMIWRRALVALPFCAFAGLSNVIFVRETAFYIGSLPVSFGTISFFTIIFRTLLCVSAVLILVAVTPFAQLTAQLRRMHVPQMLISVFEMTYRYIGTLVNEAYSMSIAYKLRAGDKKGVQMKDMGSFAGQLLLRSFDRAERVYAAMKCRSYAMRDALLKPLPLKKNDYIFTATVCLSCVLFRAVDVQQMLTAVLGRMM